MAPGGCRLHSQDVVFSFDKQKTAMRVRRDTIAYNAAVNSCEASHSLGDSCVKESQCLSSPGLQWTRSVELYASMGGDSVARSRKEERPGVLPH